MAVEADIKKEIGELRERVVRLEVKIEELTKRFDKLSNYVKDLYGYLQKQQGKTLF